MGSCETLGHRSHLHTPMDLPEVEKDLYEGLAQQAPTFLFIQQRKGPEGGAKPALEFRHINSQAQKLSTIHHLPCS